MNIEKENKGVIIVIGLFIFLILFSLASIKQPSKTIVPETGFGVVELSNLEEVFYSREGKCYYNPSTIPNGFNFYWYARDTSDVYGWLYANMKDEWKRDSAWDSKICNYEFRLYKEGKGLIRTWKGNRWFPNRLDRNCKIVRDAVSTDLSPLFKYSEGHYLVEFHIYCPNARVKEVDTHYFGDHYYSEWEFTIGKPKPACDVGAVCKKEKVSERWECYDKYTRGKRVKYKIYVYDENCNCVYDHTETKWEDLTSCPSGTVCEDGKCVEVRVEKKKVGEPCTSDDECESGKCLSGKCAEPWRECWTDADCPEGYSCVDGKCEAVKVVPDYMKCVIGQTACSEDMPLVMDYLGIDEEWVLECSEEGVWTAKEDCKAKGMVCENGMCVPKLKKVGEPCISDEECETGKCLSGKCAEQWRECWTDADCPEGYKCEDGACIEIVAPAPTPYTPAPPIAPAPAPTPTPAPAPTPTIPTYVWVIIGVLGGVVGILLAYLVYLFLKKKKKKYKI